MGLHNAAGTGYRVRQGRHHSDDPRGGHYHETYIIEDGDWRIDSVRLTRLFLERPGDN